MTPSGRLTLAVMPIVPELRRRYIYGTDYVDELVVQHNVAPGQTTPSVYHVLQDANWNVTALTNSPTDSATNPTIVQQYHYEPQGPFAAVESGAGTALPTPYDFMQFLTYHLFHGMTWDPILQLYCTPSGRCYDPKTGHWLQADFNGLGLHMSAIPHYHGMSPHFSPYVSQRSNSLDGPNLYGFARFNPNMYTDAMGLSSQDFDWMGETQELEDEWVGHRLYALHTIQEGAAWASLGMQTAVDIGASLLGIDVVQSAWTLAQDGGDFWDVMNVALAATPVGRVSKIGKNASGALGKGIKLAQRGSQGGKLAVKAAEHLYKIKPYKEARKLTAGWGGQIKAHHILEARHAERWGLDVGAIPSVILTHNEHVTITNALQTALKTGTKDGYTQKQVWAAYQKVYADLGYADWLDHIEKYFK